MKRSLFLLTIASYLALTLTLFDFSVPTKTIQANSTTKPDDLIVHE